MTRINRLYVVMAVIVAACAAVPCLYWTFSSWRNFGLAVTVVLILSVFISSLASKSTRETGDGIDEVSGE